MNESSSFGGEWVFAFLIIAVLFGWGGNGNNRSDSDNGAVLDAINAQTSTLNQQSILLSSANNNYETARLIDSQTMAMMNQGNTNLVNAIQGFNTVNQNIATVNQNIADLGYRMDKCCCEIKTMMLENRLQDTQIALQNAQNIAVNSEQSQYLLSQLGSFVPKAATTAG